MKVSLHEQFILLYYIKGYKYVTRRVPFSVEILVLQLDEAACMGCCAQIGCCPRPWHGRRQGMPEKVQGLQRYLARLKRAHAKSQPRSGSGAVCVPAPTWHLRNAMNFLAPRLRRRLATSNFVQSK